MRLLCIFSLCIMLMGDAQLLAPGSVKYYRARVACIHVEMRVACRGALLLTSLIHNDSNVVSNYMQISLKTLYRFFLSPSTKFFAAEPEPTYYNIHLKVILLFIWCRDLYEGQPAAKELIKDKENHQR